MDNWAQDGGDVGFCQLGASALAGPPITDTNWHQVVATKAGPMVTFYLDGAVVSTQSYNVTFTFTGNFAIGYRPDNGDNGFYGTLDEVRVYNRPLSASEIQGLYLSDSSGGPPAPAPVTITNQPVSLTVAVGQSVSFTVLAGGTPPLKYTWLFNGTNLPNSASNVLAFAEVAPANSGAYSVIVSNDYGSVTSSIANLYLIPYLQTPFSGALTYWGQTNTFSVIAGGNGNLSYQWYFNGGAIPSATSSNLVFSNIQFTNAGLYSVVVSSIFGSVTNTPEQVVVNPANTALKFFANVMIRGTVGYTYMIQSSTDLSNPNAWITETNLILTQPVEYWDDTSVDVHTSLQKFYRILPGQ